MGAGQRLDAASGISQLKALHIPIAATGVTINAPKVVLGDIATAGSLNVNSADIELLGRAPVPGAPAIQQGTFDQGLSLIGTSVHLSSRPTFVPGTPQQQQQVYIAADSISGFTPSASVIFVQDSSVVSELSAFDAAHPTLQPTDGALPSLPIAATPTPPFSGGRKSSTTATLPFGFIIDDNAILALLNAHQPDMLLLELEQISILSPLDDDEWRWLLKYRHDHRRRDRNILFLTQPDYAALVNRVDGH